MQPAAGAEDGPPGARPARTQEEAAIAVRADQGFPAIQERRGEVPRVMDDRAPAVAEMYPPGAATRVGVPGLGDILEGAVLSSYLLSGQGRGVG